MRPDVMNAWRNTVSVRVREHRYALRAAWGPLEKLAYEAKLEADLFMYCALLPHNWGQNHNLRIKHGLLAYIGIDIFSGDT